MNDKITLSEPQYHEYFFNVLQPVWDFTLRLDCIKKHLLSEICVILLNLFQQVCSYAWFLEILALDTNIYNSSVFVCFLTIVYIFWLLAQDDKTDSSWSATCRTSIVYLQYKIYMYCDKVCIKVTFEHYPPSRFPVM